VGATTPGSIPRLEFDAFATIRVVPRRPRPLARVALDRERAGAMILAIGVARMSISDARACAARANPRRSRFPGRRLAPHSSARLDDVKITTRRDKRVDAEP
jgi:hypothetical protein